MKTSKKHVRFVWIVAVATLLLGAGCSSMKSKDSAPAATAAKTPTAVNPTPTPGAQMPAAQLPAAGMALKGANEVPANPSAASGQNMIVIGADKSVTGSIEVMGMTPTAAHIHEAAAGANGPVIVPFTKSGDNTFTPAAGAKLTDDQYAAYQAGKLYINVHSAAYPGGEIRVQIAPPAQ